MDNLLKFLEIVGLLGTIFAVISAIMVTYWTFRGFVPVLIRLGRGLWRRKIAIVASGDALSNLKGLLTDSRLFNTNRIIQISDEGELEAASTASLILVYWPDCMGFIDEILEQKKEQTALIIYAPHKGGPIPIDVMQKLELKKHVIVNNFRGRLMNDIVTSMITTGYEKK